MAATGAGRKALVFTESRRTQEYLKQFLESHGYAGQVVLFNGTNVGPEATAIYEQWAEKNKDTGRASGSRAVDIRTALIEHFRDTASIMLATEAAAERWSYFVGQVCGKVKLQLGDEYYAACLFSSGSGR